MPHFEVDPSPSSRRRRGETVTVMTRGYLSLSHDTWTRLGSPEAVRVLADYRERLVGFQACAPGDEDARPVRGRAHMVSAVTLLKQIGADLSRSRRYPLHAEDGAPPYIDLKELVPVVTSGRRRDG